tara:strand:+ start:72 stop:188 length:117 start_codon:yes stop_codon:yes gene_type:complete
MESRILKEIDPYRKENLDKWFGNPPLQENLIQENIKEG